MGSELKHKVATGVAWNISEKIGTMLLQMAVSFTVLWLLSPEDFGVMAIMTFFTSLALVVVDSGFSQTLIRKSDPTHEDYGSVFAFNIAMSVVLYIVLTAVSPLVAHFYRMPVITKIAPILFLLFPINALCVIQNTIFTRQFRFGLLSRATLASSLAGDVAAVGLALAGCGIWSLVAQRLVTAAVKTAILWLCNSRPPVGRFSAGALRAMSSFSLRLLGTDIISAVYNNLAQMFVGAKYPADVLGYFNQAQKFKELPVTSTQQAVQSVTYPALSKLDGDVEKFSESYRQLIMTVAFMMFPMMIGMAAVVDDAFMLVLGPKWMPIVPYLRILALTGLFAPLASIALNILKVGSDGAIILRLEVAKKIVTTAILLITVMHSVKAVAWGLVVVAAMEFVVNITASTRYTRLTLWRVVRTLLPVVFVTAAMYAAVMVAAAAAAELALPLRLFIKILTGIVVYTALAFGFRLESAREVRSVARRLFGR